MRRYTLSDFDYALPSDLIAQVPAAERGGSRLLHVDGNVLADLTFGDLPRLLARGDLVVFNDTRVIKARLRASRPTGGKVELLYERAGAVTARPFSRFAPATRRTGAASCCFPAGPARPSSSATVASSICASKASRRSSTTSTGMAKFRCRRTSRVRRTPWTRRATRPSMRASRAPPRRPPPVCISTTRCSLRSQRAGIATAFVTLHVGAGTFQPVESEDLASHRMHAERYRISPETAAAIATTRARGGRVVAIGTTSLRALESAADDAGHVRAEEAETRLFITPGYRFRVVDRLVTNFHLPKSTLLMLVSAFSGHASHSRRVRACDRRALSLLQLRRRDAARARTGGIRRVIVVPAATIGRCPSRAKVECGVYGFAPRLSSPMKHPEGSRQ